MRYEPIDTTGTSAARIMRSAAPRRPWLLIAAALLLAVLSMTLWVKWKDSRSRAEQLHAELRQVYAEAETLRTVATRAQQRIGELERQVRALSARPATDKEPRPAAKPKALPPR